MQCSNCGHGVSEPKCKRCGQPSGIKETAEESPRVIDAVAEEVKTGNRMDGPFESYADFAKAWREEYGSEPPSEDLVTGDDR
jgi:hypothetical protein